MNSPGLLTPPATVYPPTQADDGAQVYFYICLVCHGDRGQGLTEWRKNLTPPDNNCWQSKCHAPNHMEGSFTFPREVPPVVGPGVLLGFQNALNLHDYISTKMPWQAPGSLKVEQYWQLTAYLIRANGVDPGLQPLNAANAAKLSFVKPTPAAQTQGTAGILGALILAAIGVVGAVVLIQRLARKGGNGSSRDSL
jgi:mono/diheme cytochrome c family protein